MGRRVNYPCSCGHMLKLHWMYQQFKRMLPQSTEFWNPCMKCECKNYKTDNLILIEWMAKERGLV
jgi:hypothetical protein